MDKNTLEGWGKKASGNSWLLGRMATKGPQGDSMCGQLGLRRPPRPRGAGCANWGEFIEFSAGRISLFRLRPMGRSAGDFFCALLRAQNRSGRGPGIRFFTPNLIVGLPAARRAASPSVLPEKPQAD